MDWFCGEDLNECRCFIVRHADADVLCSCASGGAFTAIATAFVSKGGVVFGAVYGKDMRVVHAETDKAEGVRSMSSSKYVQSEMGNCFKSVEGYLRNERDVLFSGAPCQIAGLKAFLEAKGLHEDRLARLYCVDFVCHAVGSPMVFQSYVDEGRSSGFDIVSINMRSKYYGYHNGSIELVSKSGKSRHVSTGADRFLRAFYSNCISRPSCHDCSFKGIQRPSELTLWDSWNAETILGKRPDNKGYTNVIARGERGLALLEFAGDALETASVPFADIAPRNGGMLMNSCLKSDEREKFLMMVSSVGITAASNEVFPVGVREQVRELAKSLLWRLGLLDYVVRMKRAMK